MVTSSQAEVVSNLAPGGKDSVEVKAGEYFHVPAGLIHREVNPSDRDEYETIYVSTGSGPCPLILLGPRVNHSVQFQQIFSGVAGERKNICKILARYTCKFSM